MCLSVCGAPLVAAGWLQDDVPISRRALAAQQPIAAHLGVPLLPTGDWSGRRGQAESRRRRLCAPLRSCRKRAPAEPRPLDACLRWPPPAAGRAAPARVVGLRAGGWGPPGTGARFLSLAPGPAKPQGLGASRWWWQPSRALGAGELGLFSSPCHHSCVAPLACAPVCTSHLAPLAGVNVWRRQWCLN